MKQPAFRLVFASIVLLWTACDEDPAGRTGEFAQFYAFVEGTVSDTAGTAFIRATGTIAILEIGCSGEPLTRSGMFLLDDERKYRVLMSIPAVTSEGFVGCIEVDMVPLMSTGLGPGFAQLDGVVFGRTPNSAPTVELDVQVESTP